jgi:MSHA biogenesis protein MshN
MSVVNKMLQDLEARKADTSTVNADYQPPLKRSRILWYVLLLLIATLLMAYWFYTNNSLSLLKSNNEPVQVTEIQSQAMSVKPMLVEPSKIVAIQDESLVEPQVAKQTDLTQVDASEPPLAKLSNQQQKALTLPELNESFVSEPIEESSAEVSQPVPVKPASFQMKGSSQASQTASLKQQLKDALADNNNALSIKLLGQLIEQEPDNVEAIKKLAALLFANGNVLKATQFLQSHVQLAPLRGDLRLMLARLHVQQNKPDAALAVLKEIQPAQYMEIDYFSYRANLAQQLNDFAVAKQDYTLLTQVDANNARWWLGLAITEEKLGDNKMALDCYYQAQHLAQLDPAVTDFIKQRISLLAGKQ